MGRPPEDDHKYDDDGNPKPEHAEPDPPAKPAAKAKRAAKAKAAVAEVKKQPKAVEYEGLRFSLPDEFPEELFLDMIEAEASDSDVNQYLVLLRILRSLLGPEAFLEVRYKLGRDAEKVVGLVNATLEQYGVSLGESAASSAS